MRDGAVRDSAIVGTWGQEGEEGGPTRLWGWPHGEARPRKTHPQPAKRLRVSGIELAMNDTSQLQLLTTTADITYWELVISHLS